jgi:acetolactate synthase-1/2/3 large subunit
MTIGEMETASRYDLQLAAVVINNAAYGTIRGKQAAESRALFATDLTTVDFPAFAAGCGWQARNVDGECDLEAGVDWLLSSPGRRLLELRTMPGADLDPEGVNR